MPRKVKGKYGDASGPGQGAPRSGKTAPAAPHKTQVRTAALSATVRT